MSSRLSTWPWRPRDRYGTYIPTKYVAHIQGDMCPVSCVGHYFIAVRGPFILVNPPSSQVKANSEPRAKLIIIQSIIIQSNQNNQQKP